MKSNFEYIVEFSGAVQTLTSELSEGAEEVEMSKTFNEELVYWFGAFLKKIQQKRFSFLENCCHISSTGSGASKRKLQFSSLSTVCSTRIGLLAHFRNFELDLLFDLTQNVFVSLYTIAEDGSSEEDHAVAAELFTPPAKKRKPTDFLKSSISNKKKLFALRR
jgi:hypothetical protein